jgi:hypothetical protein
VISEGMSCESALNIAQIPWVLPPVVVGALAQLDTAWDLPGICYVDAMGLSEARRTLHVGFYYRWIESADPQWLTARAGWSRAVRDYVRGAMPGLDTEGLLRAACARGEAPTEETAAAWAEWEPWHHVPPPPTEAVWLDTSLVRDAVRRATGLVWYQHTAEAAMLAAYGLRVARLDETPTEGPVAVSMRAHGRGRNLQAYAEGLALAPCTGEEEWEQVLGRTHRQGQEADVVTHKVYVSSAVERDMTHAEEEAVATAQLTGSPRRLLLGLYGDGA